MADAPIERTAAQTSAFERCKAARQAALERKKKAKERLPTSMPSPEPKPAPVVETPTLDDSGPVPPEPPVQDKEEALVQAPEEDLEFVDADVLLTAMQKQNEMFSELKDEIKSLRTYQEELKQHQQDLSHSFTRHDIAQQYSINFV